jgi:RNA polymerase sigma-70 factor (ECF subfamily)
MRGAENKNKSNWLKNSIAKAKQLDREAFEELYVRHLTPIYRYFIVRTADKTLSEDLAHSVFLKAWSNADKLSDLDTSLPWLFAIARNTLIDYWRKKKEVLVDNVEIFEASGATGDVLEEHEYKQQIEKIRSVLGSLSEDQREMVLMKFFEGLTNKEISTITRRSPTAVRALQYRALMALKQNIENEKK